MVLLNADDTPNGILCSVQTSSSTTQSIVAKVAAALTSSTNAIDNRSDATSTADPIADNAADLSKMAEMLESLAAQYVDTSSIPGILPSEPESKPYDPKSIRSNP